MPFSQNNNLNESIPIIKKAININDAWNTGNISGLNGIAKASVMAALIDDFKSSSFLIISTSSDETEQIYSNLLKFLPTFSDNIYLFDADDIEKRISSLNSISTAKSIIVATKKAASKKIISKLNYTKNKIKVSIGDKITPSDLAKRLILNGYIRVPIVEDYGEISLRGGILDVYSYAKKPIRIEFGPEEIDSLREFNPITQISERNIGEAEILPNSDSGKSDIFDYFGEGDKLFLDYPINFNEPIKIPKKLDKIEFYPLKLSAFSFSIGCLNPPSFSGKIDDFVSHIKSLDNDCFIVSKQAARIKEIFFENNIFSQKIRFIAGEIQNGFVFPKANIHFFSDKEIFGEHVPRRRFEVTKKEISTKELYANFENGDFVVHKNYGIGVYRGIVLEEAGGIASDYILIEYDKGDKLYFPVFQMHLISKYSAPGDYKPKLNRLGTNEWTASKNRAKKSIKKLTENLNEIYSVRKNNIGIKFSPDSDWQTEFEAAFPYEATPDQIKAECAVKSAMESGKPMDHIVCGDVGYGKTEIALRAAFKAVSSGYQAAVLAPTTILADQHYHTFKERFAAFPFVVKMLSRFSAAKEQDQTIKAIQSGGVDVVIGTHRMIQKDVKFKKLGLLVIDEEQRFGVSHKERIKNLMRNIDVLTLTATPIPRTLYMALSGIWDISMISTPPVGRMKVDTFIEPWDVKTIRKAIDLEIERGGQIFYVHNRVETIYDTAVKIQKIFPKLKVACGHGQMNEKHLEKVMDDFIDRKYDLLVSTAIIESGLDIPNVNTIIVDHPHRFGLSTLYQLRGRVGRSNVKAYAYFLYNKGDTLSKKALERLNAIKSFTELGSGYKIAMRDLEIRGAGDILGANQSGHMASIGFDLYCEMLEEAALEIKGEKVFTQKEPLIDIKVSAIIPINYINDDSERIAIYKRLNNANSSEDINEIKKELIDRFGALPQEVDFLFSGIGIKLKAQKLGIDSIIQKDNSVVIEKLGRKYKVNVSGLSQKEMLIKIKEGLN